MAKKISKKPKVARQYELSQQAIVDSAIDQGGDPNVPATVLGPDIRPNENRGNINSKNDSKANTNFHLGLQDIDEAIFYYFENVIKPSVLSNGDLIDVPVIYGSGERWKLAQKDGFYRDRGGKVQTPLVMLKRESIEKRRDLGNKLDANNPQLYITQQEKYTKKNSYDRFSIINNRIPQKEFNAVVIPDYVNLTYSGIIWTDYISQLNKIIEAVNYSSDSYWGDPERFKFMAMIDQFTNINELSNDDGRIVRANFTLKLQGYVVPDNVQKKLKEQNTRFFSKAQIVLNQSTTVIEEPSTRAKSLSSPTTGGGGGGGGATNINTSITNIENTGADNDWLISDEFLISHENKKVKVRSSLIVNNEDSSNTDNLFLISQNGNDALKVDTNKVLSLIEFTNEPSTVDGGIIYLEGEFYLGL
mgnify:CR=1 FL=1|tara:strand:- start:3841 stop:5091 length:1251 start_codon:yes stop_codon:yes gene_type:complete